jgi:glucose dehydrogenase
MRAACPDARIFGGAVFGSMNRLSVFGTALFAFERRMTRFQMVALISLTVSEFPVWEISLDFRLICQISDADLPSFCDSR